jgi:hypothetical protein
MAAPVTLEAMIQSVRRRANIESQLGFITDAEITELLNYGCSAVYDLLVEAKGQEFYKAQYTFSTTSNNQTYPLPPDMFQLMTVDLNLGNNIVLTCRPFMPSERNRFRWYWGWSYSQPVWYRIQGPSIVFIPAPSAVYSVTLGYYPTYQQLSDPSDSFDGINGWEEYGIWSAVADCKAKGDEDPSYALGKMRELKEKIEAMAADRAGYDAERVHDVTADYDAFDMR